MRELRIRRVEVVEEGADARRTNVTVVALDTLDADAERVQRRAVLLQRRLHKRFRRRLYVME